jgi:hypothetical protein
MHLKKGGFMKQLREIFIVLAVAVFLSFPASPSKADTEARSGHPALRKVIEQTFGKVTVVRIDQPEKSPLEGMQQIRVWIESAYGETPVLFYSSEKGDRLLAGSVFDADGENLTKKEVGKTKPKVIAHEKMLLRPEYSIGNAEAETQIVLWLGADPFSRRLFQDFFDVWQKNQDKVILFVKFYPIRPEEVEKMKALTCYQGDSFSRAIKIIYDANPAWGSAEDLDAFRSSGNLEACNEDFVREDIALAQTLKLPRHAIAFINGEMVLEMPASGDVAKRPGVLSQQDAGKASPSRP